MKYKRFDIWLTTLEPSHGSEMRKTRPCIIISPDEMNDYLNTIIVAPLTSTRKNYPFRINCIFANTLGQIALDHSRGLDKSRLIKKIGTIDKTISIEICDTLCKMFEY